MTWWMRPPWCSCQHARLVSGRTRLVARRGPSSQQEDYRIMTAAQGQGNPGCAAAWAARAEELAE
jgi:hypothetical protein